MILEESLVGSPLVQIVWQRLQHTRLRQNIDSQFMISVDPSNAEMFLICTIYLMFPGGNPISCISSTYILGGTYTIETAQHLITAGYDLDDLDCDLSDMPDMCEKKKDIPITYTTPWASCLTTSSIEKYTSDSYITSRSSSDYMASSL